MVITEDEVKAIDDWRFAHRVPSRSEAIRRLCQIAMRYEEQESGLKSALRNVADAMKSTTAKWRDRKKPGEAAEELEMVKDEYRKLYRRANILMFRAQVGRLQGSALAKGGDVKEAMRIADEKRAELEEKISFIEDNTK
jgi:hypothetical protein